VLEKKLKERREFVERFGTQDVVNPEASIDYRRKRGMLEEINRAVVEVEQEAQEEKRITEENELEKAGAIEDPPSIPRGSGSVPAEGVGDRTAPSSGSSTPPPSSPPPPSAPPPSN